MLPKMRDQKERAGAETRQRTSHNPISDLYALLSDPRFAIIVIITLAIASILGIVIVDQIPFRGEMARLRFEDRQNDPWIWLLIHLVPMHPFRCFLFRALLALLSMSLLACVIRRWRGSWRRALMPPQPSAAARPGPATLVWTSREPPGAQEMLHFFRRRLFTVRHEPQDSGFRMAASRFGIARLGAVLTHLGFLLLVVGGLWIASTGFSRMVWMSPGDTFDIPGMVARLELLDFRIETTPEGRIADYISSVRLMRDTTLVREMDIEVNKPLRYQGHSIYQSSYRRDPRQVCSLNLVFDAPTVPIQSAQRLHRNGEGMQVKQGSQPRHMIHTEISGPFANPITLRLLPGEQTALPGTPYAIAIDTFLIDFRVGPGGAYLGSDEPQNPAARIAFFEGDNLIGQTWYFLFHPDMRVGDGLDLPLRFANFEPHMQTGLELATHPGSGWIWAGIVIMSLGTLLSFMLRHERVWLEVRARGALEAEPDHLPQDSDQRRGSMERPPGLLPEEGWEIAVTHIGAPPQDPALAKEPWGASITPLAAQMLKQWSPLGGAPSRWPASGSDAGSGTDTAAGVNASGRAENS
ncbi:MAG: cytochrome c biogenesis protein ResB [Candidatus Eisenbacteria sp.]|nr:cytochrome c biogenesis protein ResB [Candidatus Eisenbacteria bacterium]